MSGSQGSKRTAARQRIVLGGLLASALMALVLVGAGFGAHPGDDVRALSAGRPVTVTLSRCSDGPRTVTVAPGSTAPVESWMVPAIEPVTWARAGNVDMLRRRMRERMNERYHVDDIEAPLKENGSALLQSCDIEVKRPRPNEG